MRRAPIATGRALSSLVQAPPRRFVEPPASARPPAPSAGWGTIGDPWLRGSLVPALLSGLPGDFFAAARGQLLRPFRPTLARALALATAAGLLSGVGGTWRGASPIASWNTWWANWNGSRGLRGCLGMLIAYHPSEGHPSPLLPAGRMLRPPSPQAKPATERHLSEPQAPTAGPAREGLGFKLDMTHTTAPYTRGPRPASIRAVPSHAHKLCREHDLSW